MTERTERIVVAALVAANFLLALGFSSGPIFEAADEGHHYRFVRYLAVTRALPTPETLDAGNEVHQAPLYYTLAALISPFDNTRVTDAVTLERNPFFGYEAWARGSDNKNSHLHSSREAFPYTADTTTLAIHVIRLIGVLASAGTVLFSALLYRLVWPHSPDLRVIALSLVAFWPQFLHIAGVVSNDSLIALTAAASLWLLVRHHGGGPTWISAAWLGVGLGAALLSKSNAALLVFPVGAATILDRRSWKFAPVTLAVTLAIAGWWYLRNLSLYGEPSGISLHYLLEPRSRIEPSELNWNDWLWRMTVYLWPSVWARFGTDDILMVEWLYGFFDALTILMAGGLMIQLVRAAISVIRARAERVEQAARMRQGFIVGLFALSWLGALGLLTVTSYNGPYGRHLLPGIAGWGTLFAWGLGAWTPSRLRARAALSIVAAMAAAAMVSFAHFRLAYHVFPLPAAIEKPLDYRYEGQAALIGIDAGDFHARPGDRLFMTLYWRAAGPSDRPLTAYLHTFDADIVRRDSHPATGNLLSIDWRPGQAWSERYRIAIPDDSPTQRVATLIAGLYDPAANRALIATDASGGETLPVVGRLIVHGPAAPFDPDTRFGGAIGMAEPDIKPNGDTFEVCLRWVSLAPVASDYQVFVHALAGNGELVSQADFQAGGGAYPSSVWWVGESIRDCATLDASNLPASGWRIAVGLYDLNTGLRLAAVDRAGDRLPDDAVIVER